MQTYLENGGFLETYLLTILLDKLDRKYLLEELLIISVKICLVSQIEPSSIDIALNDNKWVYLCMMN